MSEPKPLAQQNAMLTRQAEIDRAHLERYRGYQQQGDSWKCSSYRFRFAAELSRAEHHESIASAAVDGKPLPASANPRRKA